MKRARQAGFTLVELLTVVAIIALLSAIILGLAGLAQKKAARSRAEAEITQWGNVLTQWQVKYGRMPTNLNQMVSTAEFQSQCTITNTMDPWGMPYAYTRTSDATYNLGSYGGDGTMTNRALWVGNPK